MTHFDIEQALDEASGQSSLSNLTDEECLSFTETQELRELFGEEADDE